MSTVSCSSLDDVVSFAIEKEEKAMDFYRKCAEIAGNPGMKDFFEELAREEQRHRDMLRNLDTLQLAEVKLEKVEDLRISDYLLDIPFDRHMSYQEALTLAMKKEEKAHAFYAGWKNKCIHEKAASLFAILENEEAKHKRKLEALYDEEVLTEN